MLLIKSEESWFATELSVADSAAGTVLILQLVSSNAVTTGAEIALFPTHSYFVVDPIDQQQSSYYYLFEFLFNMQRSPSHHVGIVQRLHMPF